MMKLATYGIQGDIFEILPKLIISFKEALGDISQAKTKDLCAITKEV
jgi:Electron transfer flavoprotein, alpha subunit